MASGAIAGSMAYCARKRSIRSNSASTLPSSSTIRPFSMRICGWGSSGLPNSTSPFSGHSWMKLSGFTGRAAGACARFELRWGSAAGCMSVGFQRRFIAELPSQLLQTSHLLPESHLGVALSAVIQDANRPMVSAVADDPELLQFPVSFAELQKHRRVFLHTIQIDGHQVRQNLREKLSETVHLLPAMVEIVNHSDIRRRGTLQDRQLVFRLAKPAAMVIEPHRAVDFLRLPRQVLRGFGGLGHLLLLRQPIERRWRHQQIPDLGLQLASFPQVQNGVHVLFLGWLQPRGQPESLQLDAVFLERIDFLIKGWDVLVAPVIDKPRDAQAFQHPCACHWAPVPGIKKGLMHQATRLLLAKMSGAADRPAGPAARENAAAASTATRRLHALSS